MIRFIFRLAGMIALSIAAIMAVLDLHRSIAASIPVLTPFGDSWEFAFPDASATGDGLAVWSEVVRGFAGLPGFAVFAILAALLLVIGRRRHRRTTA